MYSYFFVFNACFVLSQFNTELRISLAFIIYLINSFTNTFISEYRCILTMTQNVDCQCRLPKHNVDCQNQQLQTKWNFRIENGINESGKKICWPNEDYRFCNIRKKKPNLHRWQNQPTKKMDHFSDQRERCDSSWHYWHTKK